MEISVVLSLSLTILSTFRLSLYYHRNDYVQEKKADLDVICQEIYNLLPNIYSS